MSELRVSIDGQTKIPMDLFQDLLSQAKRTHFSGQHDLVISPRRGQRLSHHISKEPRSRNARRCSMPNIGVRDPEVQPAKAAELRPRAKPRGWFCGLMSTVSSFADLGCRVPHRSSSDCSHKGSAEWQSFPRVSTPGGGRRPSCPDTRRLQSMERRSAPRRTAQSHGPRKCSSAAELPPLADMRNRAQEPRRVTL